MSVDRSDSRSIRSSEDVVKVRQLVREYAKSASLSLVDETKIVTAASELARNVLQYGGGGTVQLELVSEGPRRGVRLVFEDQGPGIADIELALRDGYSTGGAQGLGLSGALRLANVFSLESKPRERTRVMIARWR
jgi:serine/threonine-protein kinase RsbT